MNSNKRLGVCENVAFSTHGYDFFLESTLVIDDPKDFLRYAKRIMFYPRSKSLFSICCYPAEQQKVTHKNVITTLNHSKTRTNRDTE